MSAIATGTRISLEVACYAPCILYAAPLYTQMSSGKYDKCSVLDMPASVDEWRADHRTARKRADRAARLGYTFDEIKRERFNHDIYAINTSLAERQGRPMSAAYSERPRYAPLPAYGCDRHRVRSFGVLTRGTLVAYLWLYRVGQLALVSSILGHGSHLTNDVMYLLMQGTIDAEADHGGFLVYNRHDSGTDGLRYFKDRIGFRETRVEWAA